MMFMNALLLTSMYATTLAISQGEQREREEERIRNSSSLHDYMKSIDITHHFISVLLGPFGWEIDGFWLTVGAIKSEQADGLPGGPYTANIDLRYKGPFGWFDKYVTTYQTQRVEIVMDQGPDDYSSFGLFFGGDDGPLEFSWEPRAMREKCQDKSTFGIKPPYRARHSTGYNGPLQPLWRSASKPVPHYSADKDPEVDNSTVYAIRSVSSGNFLDGRVAGFTEPKLTCRDPKGSDGWCLKWKLQSVDGNVALVSVSSGASLDGRGGQCNPYLNAATPCGNSYLQFQLVKVSDDGRFALKGVASGMYLDGRNDQSDPLMTASDPYSDTYLQWEFVKC